MDTAKLLCMTEEKLDTIEISLRESYNIALSKGDVRGADYIESILDSLDRIPIC